MPEAGAGRQPQDELIGLLTERDVLHRRLTWVDTRVTQLQLTRNDAMIRRLASLEEALLRWAPPAAAVQRTVVTGPPPAPFVEVRTAPPAAPVAPSTPPFIAPAPVTPSREDAAAARVTPDAQPGLGPVVPPFTPTVAAPPLWSRRASCRSSWHSLVRL